MVKRVTGNPTDAKIPVPKHGLVIIFTCRQNVKHPLADGFFFNFPHEVLLSKFIS
jgi:hypothetical protein